MGTGRAEELLAFAIPKGRKKKLPVPSVAVVHLILAFDKQINSHHNFNTIAREFPLFAAINLRLKSPSPHPQLRRSLLNSRLDSAVDKSLYERCGLRRSAVFRMRALSAIGTSSIKPFTAA